LKPLVAPHIAALRPDDPGKPAAELVREPGMRGAVRLTSNENPLGPSPHVLSALAAAAADVHRYADNDVRALRERLAALHGVDGAEIAFGHGSNSLIELCARTFAGPSDHAIIGTPSFSCYAASLAAANVPTTAVALRDDLFWDLSAVLEAVRPETKLVFLDNPGNPTSTHIARAELQGFLRELEADVVVVVDEAYGDFADHESYASALGMRELRERLIVLRTFSKAYALAGLRVGYAVAPRAAVAHLRAMQVPFHVSGPAQAAALAALSDRAHLQRTLELIARERQRMTAALQQLGLSVAPSQTNFVLVALPASAEVVHAALFERGVIVQRPGPPLSRHLRISIGLPHENDRVLRELAEALARLAP
jgi:histidinol-phosphate aminotransferase